MLRDLSHPIVDGTIAYPGDPEVHVSSALVLAQDGVAVARLTMGSHTGTHVDAPAHTVAGGRSLDQVALDELVGPAIVLRVPGMSDGAGYGWREIAAANDAPVRVPRIVVVDTGWARWWGHERQLRHPTMDAAAARELWRRGMRVLVVDTMSPDRTEADGTDFPVHDVVLGGDGLIVENACGLDDLPTRVRVGFFPLRLTGDGAPARGVAFLDEPGHDGLGG